MIDIMRDSEQRITLSAVGDVCLGMGVRNNILQNGKGFPFQKVKGLLLKSDLRFGNLEVTFPGKAEERHINGSDIWADDGAIETLCDAKFDVMSVANNHVMDYGEPALEHTCKLMQQNKIMHFGAGKTLIEAIRPAILERNKIRLGFLGYADNEGQVASFRKAGAAETIAKNILKDVKSLRPKVHVVVVSLHTGIEFSHYPSPYQIRLSRRIADAGADLILGHHPHVLQGIEIYKKSLICYSLGNFVFHICGNEYQQEHLPFTAMGVLLRITLCKQGYALHDIFPSIINNDHRPYFPDNDESAKMLKHISDISEALKYPDKIEQSYRITCRGIARSYYYTLRTAIKDRRMLVLLKLVGTLLLRDANRRWLSGFLRGIVRWPLPKKK